jgi:Asp-tRNA(Asn)/Glu-tRNA(Gln) amidotransferase A subunit family amidase
MQEMERLDVDLYVAPSFGGDNLLLTNLTGHPCVVVPTGVDSKGNNSSISFIGTLFGEGKLLAAARAYQEATDFDERHPPFFRE